jgi:hypothetical protein
MTKISLAMSLDVATKSIKLSRDDNEFATVEFASDINFTPLVDAFSTLLDEKSIIELENEPVTTDPKAIVVCKAIKEIVAKFNETQRDCNPQSN